MPESVLAQENDYALRVLEGIVSPEDADNHFVFITTVDADDRRDDPKAWAKANSKTVVLRGSLTAQTCTDRA